MGFWYLALCSAIKALTSMHKCIYSQEPSLLAYCHDTQSLDLDEVSEQFLHHLLARSESTSISRMVYTYVISTQIALADYLCSDKVVQLF